MSERISRNTVPVVLDGTNDYTVQSDRSPVTVIQVVEANDTAFGLSGSIGDSYYSALPLVDLRTMDVYFETDVVRPAVGDYFGAYTPGMESLQINNIGTGGKLFVSCLNVDGSPIAERIAAAALNQDNLLSVVASMGKTQEVILEFLIETRKVFETMMGN